jgi:hypothetical protein
MPGISTSLIKGSKGCAVALAASGARCASDATVTSWPARRKMVALTLRTGSSSSTSSRRAILLSKRGAKRSCPETASFEAGK